MDIAALSTSMALTDIQSQVGVAMLSKGLDTVEVLGDSMIKMMENSVAPHLGGNIDIRV